MNSSRIEVKRWLAIVCLAVAVVAGGVAGAFATAKTGLAPATAMPLFQVSASKPLVNASSLAEGFGPVVKKALPAVVNIASEKVIRATRQQRSPFFSDPMFRDFFEQFGFGMPEERRARSLGSGVIVSPDGYIVTNDHVVHGASEITVALSDKRELDAEIVGSDPRTDIAVLKIKETGLPHLTLADSSKLEVGDIVLAMGNPFGIGQTVTMGIVSAKGRSGIIPDPQVYEDFIQTDASINQGNSGGALVNVRGELVGINTAIVAPAGGNVGIGFAVPTNMVRPVMEQIVKTGKVTRGWLGVSIQPVDRNVAKMFGLKEARGALVGDVTAESPASKAGLQRGDVILSVNGDQVEDARDLSLKIAGIKPDTRITLNVVRNGEPKQIPVTIGEMPEQQQQRRPQSRGGAAALEGVDVEELTPAIARQLGLPGDTFGVVVTGVRPYSAAAEAGLSRGDVIQEVNRKRVTNVSAFETAVRQSGDGPILLLVNRGGNTTYVVIEPR